LIFFPFEASTPIKWRNPAAPSISYPTVIAEKRTLPEGDHPAEMGTANF